LIRIYSDTLPTIQQRVQLPYECPLREDDTIRASLDWAEFQVSLARRTNFQTVRRVLGEVDYVEPLDAEAGGSASVFLFRFQNVESWSSVVAKFAELERTFGFRREPEITGLEIALDFAHGSELTHLADVACYCYRFVQFRPTSNNYRAFYHSGAAVDIPESKTQLLDWLTSGDATLYVGDHRQDAVAYRIYVKTTDSGRKLPRDEWRARTEVTLRRDALPFRTLDAAWQLQSVARHFKFLMPRSSVTRVEKVAATSLVRFARIPHAPRRAGGGFRAKPSYASADIKLNTRVYESLRCASSRMKPGSAKSGSAIIPGSGLTLSPGRSAEV